MIILWIVTLASNGSHNFKPVCIGDAQLACPGSNVLRCGQDCLRLRESNGGRCLECNTSCESFYIVHACTGHCHSPRRQGSECKVLSVRLRIDLCGIYVYSYPEQLLITPPTIQKPHIEG